MEIKGIRPPELRAYRLMAAGLDALEDYYALAPAAREVRCKLRPLRRDGGGPQQLY